MGASLGSVPSSASPDLLFPSVLPLAVSEGRGRPGHLSREPSKMFAADSTPAGLPSRLPDGLFSGASVLDLGVFAARSLPPTAAATGYGEGLVLAPPGGNAAAPVTRRRLSLRTGMDGFTGSTPVGASLTRNSRQRKRWTGALLPSEWLPVRIGVVHRPGGDPLPLRAIRVHREDAARSAAPADEDDAFSVW
jgi:hypothetical protein